MASESIQNIIKSVESKLNTTLSVYPRKKILYTSERDQLKSIAILTPESSLNSSDKGLVDLTLIQINILDKYEVAWIIFRLTNGTVYYLDYKLLKPYLIDENMTYNDRAFEHWKIHLYPQKMLLTIKGSENKVPLQNDFNYIASSSEIIYPDEVDPSTIVEGAKKKVTVNAYERSPKARAKCIEEYGYKCYICNFDFEKIYGEIGRGFIHVHHIKPLSEIKDEYTINPIEDLRPVCPNCHAMLHKRVPAHSIEEIQSLMKG